MLCPGCVEHCIPQLKQAHSFFPQRDVAVVGLHTVFEHHDAMGPTALKAFMYEYRIAFPVGIDSPGANGDPIPKTMRRYAMQGTPTLLLIDRAGNLRRQLFGHVPDLQLGAEVMGLISEKMTEGKSSGCDDDACTI